MESDVFRFVSVRSLQQPAGEQPHPPIDAYRGEATPLLLALTSTTEIELTDPYPGNSGASVPYRLGPKRVGAPWRLRIPTSLVVIDELPIADEDP